MAAFLSNNLPAVLLKPLQHVANLHREDAERLMRLLYGLRGRTGKCSRAVLTSRSQGEAAEPTMRRSLSVGIPPVLLVGLTVVTAAGAVVELRASRQQDPAVIRAGIDLARFDVIVTGKGDAVVSGLTANDFEVVEGGKPQTISVFAGGAEERPPDLHLGILFDLSSSFASGGPLQGSRYTAIELLNRLPEVVDYTLVLVDGCVQVSRFTRGEVGKLIQRIREVSEVVYPPPPTAGVGPDQRAVAVSPDTLRRVEAYRKRENKPEICYDNGVIWDGLMAYLKEHKDLRIRARDGYYAAKATVP